MNRLEQIISSQTKKPLTWLAVAAALVILFTGLALLLLAVSLPGVNDRIEAILVALPQSLAQFLPAQARAAADPNEASAGLPEMLNPGLPAAQAAQRHYDQGLV